ncbi:MAG: adenylyltransferase/cytidyltransferase family protein [Patescibacteria group bacterium]|nr:adenylyltransferase/cytidyltransferase family protein [Patescibacteria group bacterium]
MRKKKIFLWSEIDKINSYCQGKKTVLVGGCFDIFHYGHLQFFKKAKKEGDLLIVALECDDFIRNFKQREPIHTQKERAEILSHLNIVDLVVLLPFFKNDKDYFLLVDKIRPNVIAITKGDLQIENKKKQAEKVNGKLKIVIDLNKKFSSRKIINLLV